MSILKLFSPTQWMSGLKVMAIIAIAGVVVKTGSDFLSDVRNQRNALIEANAAKISAQARSQELANANTQLEAALLITQESVAASRLAVDALNRQHIIAQEESARQRAALDDPGQLQLVANGRTTLLETMVNRATKERFDELESIFND